MTIWGTVLGCTAMLQLFDGNGTVNTNHEYYFQILTLMTITKQQHACRHLDSREGHAQRAQVFWDQCVLPDLLRRFFIHFPETQNGRRIMVAKCTRQISLDNDVKSAQVRSYEDAGIVRKRDRGAPIRHIYVNFLTNTHQQSFIVIGSLIPHGTL